KAKSCATDAPTTSAANAVQPWMSPPRRIAAALTATAAKPVAARNAFARSGSPGGRSPGAAVCSAMALLPEPLHRLSPDVHFVPPGRVCLVGQSPTVEPQAEPHADPHADPQAKLPHALPQAEPHALPHAEPHAAPLAAPTLASLRQTAPFQTLPHA